MGWLGHLKGAAKSGVDEIPGGSSVLEFFGSSVLEGPVGIGNKGKNEEMRARREALTGTEETKDESTVGK